MKELFNKKRSEGFTIIEVMIVLAIAGLIMVIVFLAIPQLQRNQRNQATREVVNRMMAELENFASNNNGNYPRIDTATPIADTFGSVGPETSPNNPVIPPGTFAERYLRNSNMNDPRTGLRIGFDECNDGGRNCGGPVVGQPPVMPGSGGRTVVYWHTNRTGVGRACQGETVVNGTGARNIAVSVTLEGGAVYCVDNS